MTRGRTDLNPIGVWFADQKDDDECLGTASPVTGFDGDAQAGMQMLNSGVAILPIPAHGSGTASRWQDGTMRVR